MVDAVVEDVAAAEEAMMTETTLIAVDAEVLIDATLVDMIIVVLLWITAEGEVMEEVQAVVTPLP